MIAEQLHTRLLENMTTAVLLLDQDFNLTHINSAAENLLNLSGKRHQGDNFAELLIDSDTMLKVMRDTLELGAAHTERQATLKTLAGGSLKERRVDYTVSPVSDIEGSALVVEIQPLDRILEINREASLVNSQSANDALLKGLAHEIKNPLGGLRGAAQLLESELGNNDLREYTQIIIDEADRLRSLVDRMLGPHRPLDARSINIHRVLERVAVLTENSSGDEIELIRDYDPSIPDVDCDEDQLIQVFLNLAGNALQAHRFSSENSGDLGIDGPFIRLKSRVIRNYTIGTEHYRLVCCISVEDNGPGVPDSLKDTLFVPMVSGHAENTGLGLAIAQTIVNRHNGLITCQSEPGNTNFSVYLPIS